MMEPGVVDQEEARVQAKAIEGLVQASRIGIGDDGLPEAAATEQGEQVAHALRVDLVEDVIEQQDRSDPGSLGRQVELGQLQRDQIGLLLALRSETLQRVATDGEDQVVAMHAHRGVLGGPVAFAAGERSIRC
jgi:hypothetical protein